MIIHDNNKPFTIQPLLPDTANYKDTKTTVREKVQEGKGAVSSSIKWCPGKGGADHLTCLSYQVLSRDAVRATIRVSSNTKKPAGFVGMFRNVICRNVDICDKK